MGVGAGLYMCDVVKKFTFAISSPDEFLLILVFLVLANRLARKSISEMTNFVSSGM